MYPKIKNSKERGALIIRLAYFYRKESHLKGNAIAQILGVEFQLRFLLHQFFGEIALLGLDLVDESSQTRDLLLELQNFLLLYADLLHQPLLRRVLPDYGILELL